MRERNSYSLEKGESLREEEDEEEEADLVQENHQIHKRMLEGD